MLDLINAHPILDGIALVLLAWLMERALLILAGAVAVALRGPYRGQIVTTLDRVGFFTTAALLLCVPVILTVILEALR